MNGKTTRLIHKYASLIADESDRRRIEVDLKNLFKSITDQRARNAFRTKLIRGIRNILLQESLRSIVEETRGLRKLSAAGGRIVWFASEALTSVPEGEAPDEAAMLIEYQGDIISAVTSKSVSTLDLPMTIKAFDRYWMAACEDKIPPVHLELAMRLLGADLTAKPTQEGVAL
mgnify:CR=1 FL=1